ncbi:hypothetical protein SAMN04488115_101163 [Bosea lathyri]|uniref:Uncharacterized protein n=1 Tax=Bosea lathyri TaxID=1036778 RepID=A0A1H5S6T4_9HYPH|nr:hypothetical protein SAMN04488115_101163 [Bosea lathyri]
MRHLIRGSQLLCFEMPCFEYLPQRYHRIVGRTADGTRSVIAFEHREMNRRIPVGKQAAHQPLLIAYDPPALTIPADDEAAVTGGRKGFLHCGSHNARLSLENGSPARKASAGGP